MPITDCGKRGFDRMGRSQVNPMFGRESVRERESGFAILSRAFGGLWVLGLIGWLEQIKRLVDVLRWLHLPDIVRLDFRCHLLMFALEGTLAPWSVLILEQLLPSWFLVVFVAKRALLPLCDCLSSSA